jgi:hypothetical protein
MYFSFLFLLRAVVKAGPLLYSYPYETGNDRDDKRVRELIRKLVSITTTTSTTGHSGNSQQSTDTDTGSSVNSSPLVLSYSHDENPRSK